MVARLGELFVTGLAMGAIYALIAVGFAMIWQAIGHLNFAQGQVVMLGGFLGLAVARRLPPLPPLLSLFAIVVLSCCICALLAAAVHKTVHEPVFRSSSRLIAWFEEMNLLVATLAVGIVMENVAKLIWTGEPQCFTFPVGKGYLRIGMLTVPTMYLWIMAVAACLVGVLQLFFRYTRIGKAMRAVAQDKDAAALMGVNVRRSIMQTFVIAYVLACVAGILVAPLLYAYFANGLPLGLKGFAAAVLGGINSVPASILGGLLLGVLESLCTIVVASGYRNAVAFLVLILVLLVRPTGLLGGRTAFRA